MHSATTPHTSAWTRNELDRIGAVDEVRIASRRRDDQTHATRAERMAENFAVFDIARSPDDIAAIAALDLRESSFFDHHDPAVVKRLGEVRRPI